jgi:hypothetical protein
MSTWSKVLGDRPIRGEKPLGMPWGFEPLHAPLTLAGRLGGVFRPVVQIAVLAVLDPRENLALRCAIALQFIGDDDTWYILAPLEKLTEELLGSLLVPSTLYQDSKHIPVLIHRPPQIMPYLVDRDEHFIHMPLITRPGTPATPLIGVLLAKLAAPLANGCVRDDDATDEQEFFHVPVAERKAEIQPDGVADDLTREPVVFVEIGRVWGRHSSSTQGHHVMRRAYSPPEELRREHEYATLG